MRRHDGVPVGEALERWNLPDEGSRGWRPDVLRDPKSSIIIVVATDAPMDQRQLTRLAVRAGAGLARTGSVHGHGSGDFVIAFSNGHLLPGIPANPERPVPFDVLPENGPLVDVFFQATVEATEEAILNSMFRAETMTGRDGHTAHAIPIEETVAIMRRFGHDAVHLPGG